MLVFRAGIHKILVRIANGEDLGLCCLSRSFWQATSVRNLRTFMILADILTLCKMCNFACFLLSTDFDNKLRNAITVSNSLDPDIA